MYTISELYTRHKTGIFRYALSITKDPHLAEDVLQDTFLKVLSGAAPRNPQKVQAWLYRIARNLCYDQLRKVRREQTLPSPVPCPDNSYEFIELLASLSEKDREIVTLKIVGGLSHQEIGTVLHISAQAAQKRYHRAIQALRDKEDAYGTKTL
jgi:RNA polymerase sigma-70 factor (ECF subfamily)